MRNNQVQKWQRNTAAAAAKWQHKQPQGRAKPSQPSQNQQEAETKPCNNMHKTKENMQRIPDGARGGRTANKEPKQQGTYRASLGEGYSKVQPKNVALQQPAWGKPQVRSPAVIKKVSATGQQAPKLTLGSNKPNGAGAESQQRGARNTTCKRDKGKSRSEDEERRAAQRTYLVRRGFKVSETHDLTRAKGSLCLP
jgi:hypothetical protein